MSILFMVLYLAVPLGLATLALLDCRPADEEAREPIKVFARRERRSR
jgi:hypothetical protein